VITDQKMPQITGVELLERIGERYPFLVKVLLSGFTEVPEIQRAVDRGGIHNYVVKPVDSEKAARRRHRAIERHGRGRALSDSAGAADEVDS
jgi:YesN/AraC family two-component response regulator